MTTTRTLRAALLAAGLGCGLWGLRLLIDHVGIDGLVRLPLWLLGAVIVDDFVLIPLTLAAGWAVTRWSRGPGKHRTVGVVRTTLLCLGITTLVAIPLLIRQGHGANPTVLPRDYLRDWLLLEATILLVGVIAGMIQSRQLTLRRSRASPDDAGEP